MKLKTSVCLVALLATVVVLPAALAPGGAAYTKRAEVAMLTEPQMGSQQVARLGYAQKVSVTEIQGVWANVNASGSTGWVFGGNLSDTAPADTQGFDGLPISASNTTASAAARPLAPDSEQYAGRHGLNSASSDLNWLARANTLRPGELQDFLKANNKGEYQQ